MFKKIILIFGLLCFISPVFALETSYDKEMLIDDNEDLAIKVSLLNSKLENYKKIEEKKMHPIEKEVQECMKKENYTTAGMSYCVYESEEKWEKKSKNSLQN